MTVERESRLVVARLVCSNIPDLGAAVKTSGEDVFAIGGERDGRKRALISLDPMNYAACADIQYYGNAVCVAGEGIITNGRDRDGTDKFVLSVEREDFLTYE